MIQGNPRVVRELLRDRSENPPKVVSLWVLIEWWRPRASLMESYGDCWVVKSYKADGHNGALKAMICTQYYVTPMGSYMVRFGRVKKLNGN